MSENLLRRFSTIKIAGRAEKIIWLGELLKNPQLSLPEPVRILGNGSNVLMDDRGLRGSVILIREDPVPESIILLEDSETVNLKVSASLFGPTLAKWSSRRGYSGCEYLIGVPGTLGGAVVQNAGANEQDIQNVLKSVRVFDLKNRTSATWAPKDCGLGYRHSRFQELTVPAIVTEIEIQLKKKSAAECEKQMERNLEYRKSKTPWSKPTLGSTWKRIQDKQGQWIFPGKLIEDAGLKGFRQGALEISEVHANYLINRGDGRFEDAITLMEAVEKRVFEHSGWSLQREIQVWTDQETPARK